MDGTQIWSDDASSLLQMDRSWVYGRQSRDSTVVDGVDYFVKAAKADINKKKKGDGYIYCPCIDCKNEKQFKNVE